MGREVRRVPAGWTPPDTPHYDESFEEAFSEWHDGLHQWLDGTYDDNQKYPPRDYGEREKTALAYTYWDGQSPEPEYYRPNWTDEERTHYMLYETVSEGTSMSPAFATPTELVDWMVVHPDPVWGQRKRAAVEAFVASGYAPSMVMTSERGLEDGITGMGR